MVGGSDKQDGPHLSVIVPVYNEEKTIRPCLRVITNYLSSRGREWELIIVDDGSGDRSAEEILPYVESDDRVRFIGLGRNHGKGRAVKEGVLQSIGHRVLFCDADLSTPLEEFDKMERAFSEGYEVVIGSRKRPGAEVLKRQRWLRETMGKVFSVLARAITGVRVTDFTCGFKGFSRSAARRIFGAQRLDRWAFDAEILYLAKKYGYAIAELPVRWEDSGTSRVRFPRDIANSFAGLLAIRWNDRRGVYDEATVARLLASP